VNDSVGVNRPQLAGGDVPRTLLVLAAWFFLAVWLGVTGKLVTTGGLPIGLGAAIVLPLLVFALDGRFGHPLFGGLMRLDLSGLIAAQVFRVIGLLLLIAWLAGTLPGGFALPAAIGDLTVGLTAPLVATAVARRRSLRLAWTWNILGTADLVTAVTLGVLHGGPPLGLLAGTVTTNAVAHYPLSLIPTFGVPLALLLHVRTFGALREAAR
jgi:hypothetical protein